MNFQSSGFQCIVSDFPVAAAVGYGPWSLCLSGFSLCLTRPFKLAQAIKGGCAHGTARSCTANASAMQLAPKMRSNNALVASMTGRAEVTHFAIAGRVAIGLHLFRCGACQQLLRWSWLHGAAVSNHTLEQHEREQTGATPCICMT